MKRSIISDIRIRCKAEKIIDAFINIPKMKEWWGVDEGYIEPRDGGLYTLTWMRTKEGFKFISTGRINLYNYRSHLYLEDILYLNYERSILGPFTIKYDVEEKSNYSILSVKQNGFGKGKEWDWYYNATTEGWSQALIMLKNYLET